MVRLSWLRRAHRVVPDLAGVDLIDDHADRDVAAQLLAAFRADPAAFDLRPVVRAMTRDVVGHLLGHPAVRTAHDGVLLRQALLQAPDLHELLTARLRGLTVFVAGFGAADAAIPLSTAVDVRPLLAGAYDDMLRRLPPGSAVQLDTLTAIRHPQVAHDAAELVRRLGLRVALSGICADGTEEDVVRRLRPDSLYLDLVSPMDYRDRMTQVLRLRAEAREAREAKPHVLCAGVPSTGYEWAAVACGATPVAGPLYESRQPEDVPGAWAAGATTPGSVLEHRSPYELATSRHRSNTGTLAEILTRAHAAAQSAAAQGEHADVYVAFSGWPELPEEAVRDLECLVAAGAAVTVVAPGLQRPPLAGITWGEIPPGDALGQGWVYVVLFPGEGHLLAAHDVGDVHALLDRRFAYVDARDREMARKVANRISRCATSSTPGPAQEPLPEE